MGSGMDSDRSACCSRRWGSRLGLLNSLFGGDESDAAMGAVTERLHHRAAAATERNPGLAFGTGLAAVVRDGHRLSLMIHERDISVHPVVSLLSDLDRNLCHLLSANRLLPDRAQSDRSDESRRRGRRDELYCRQRRSAPTAGARAAA